MRVRLGLTLIKAIGKASVADSFKAPFTVGQVSEGGFWEITELEDPPGNPVGSVATIAGTLVAGENPVVGETGGAWHWEIDVLAEGLDLLVKYAVTGEGSREPEIGGFGSEPSFTMESESVETPARLVMLI